MGELDVDAMRAKIGPEKFDGWMCAYYGLGLDGWKQTGVLAAAVHNEVGPLLALKLGSEFEPSQPEDHIPQTLFSRPEPESNTDPDAARDAAIDAFEAAAQNWG